MTHDLLAMLVEVTSVPAAEMKLKKPVEIPRPGDRGAKARTPDAVLPGPEAAMKRGIAMLASTSKGARG